MAAKKAMTPEEEAAEASAESQNKPLTDKQFAKQQESFNADDRIVMRASYDETTARGRYEGGYKYFDPDEEK